MRVKENKPKKRLFSRRLKRFFLSAVLVVLMLTAYIMTKARSLDKMELAEKDVRIEELKHKIEIEDEKAEDLKKKQEGVLYEDYIEDIARSELGLIKGDEILIKPKE